MFKLYDREKAISYALKWAYGRNSAYYNFDGLGGDCTNYVSQCLYAGIGIMNFTPLYGWYYKSINDRTPSWTGVEFLYNFLSANEGAGPKAELCPLEDVMPADILQLKRGGVYTHTLFVSKIEDGNIYVCTHTYDSRNNPLSEYIYEDIRCMHII